MVKDKPKLKSDLAILKEHHQLIHEPKQPGESTTWEEKLARNYDAKLSKEFTICDLSCYLEGKLGLRWRTEREVITGKGENICANKGCYAHIGLEAYEVFFKYVEQGESKEVLVKAVLCNECGKKLSLYKSQKKKRDHTEEINQEKIHKKKKKK